MQFRDIRKIKSLTSKNETAPTFVNDLFLAVILSGRIINEIPVFWF